MKEIIGVLTSVSMLSLVFAAIIYKYSTTKKGMVGDEMDQLFFFIMAIVVATIFGGAALLMQLYEWVRQCLA